jgi:hypothetical protein
MPFVRRGFCDLAEQGWELLVEVAGWYAGPALEGCGSASREFAGWDSWDRGIVVVRGRACPGSALAFMQGSEGKQHSVVGGKEGGGCRIRLWCREVGQWCWFWYEGGSVFGNRPSAPVSADRGASAVFGNRPSAPVSADRGAGAGDGGAVVVAMSCPLSADRAGAPVSADRGTSAPVSADRGASTGNAGGAVFVDMSCPVSADRARPGGVVMHEGCTVAALLEAVDRPGARRGGIRVVGRNTGEVNERGACSRW